MRSPVCATQPLAMLVNNVGVAHYIPFAELPADKASELVHVKVTAPAMLARAAMPGMIARGEGTIINVSGMIAFSGPAPQAQRPLRRAVYAGALAYLRPTVSTSLARIVSRLLVAHAADQGIDLFPTDTAEDC